MNVTDIKGQVIKAIPMPLVSLPVEWVDAISWAKSVVTCDRAMTNYKRAWAATKWTARATWTITLVLIGLTMLAIQAWQNRQDVKDAAVLLYDRAVVKCRQVAAIVKNEAVYSFYFARNEGEVAFDAKVIAPAISMRDRLANAFSVMIQGKEI